MAVAQKKKGAAPKKVRSHDERMRRRAASLEGDEREDMEASIKTMRTLKALAPDDKDATKLVRGLFAKTGFSAVGALLEIAMNPPDDLPAKEHVSVLKFLAEFEAPKAKSVDMARLGEQQTGISVQVVSFQGASRSQMDKSDKRPLSDYDEFGAAEAMAPGARE